MIHIGEDVPLSRISDSSYTRLFRRFRFFHTICFSRSFSINQAFLYWHSQALTVSYRPIGICSPNQKKSPICMFFSNEGGHGGDWSSWRPVDASARELMDSLIYVSIYIFWYIYIYIRAVLIGTVASSFFDWRFVVPSHISPWAHWHIHECANMPFCVCVRGQQWIVTPFVFCGIMAIPWCRGPKAHRFIHIHAHEPFFWLLVAVTPYLFSGKLMTVPSLDAPAQELPVSYIYVTRCIHTWGNTEFPTLSQVISQHQWPLPPHLNAHKHPVCRRIYVYEMNHSHFIYEKWFFHIQCPPPPDTCET